MASPHTSSQLPAPPNHKISQDGIRHLYPFVIEGAYFLFPLRNRFGRVAANELSVGILPDCIEMVAEGGIFQHLLDERRRFAFPDGAVVRYIHIVILLGTKLMISHGASNSSTTTLTCLGVRILCPW